MKVWLRNEKQIEEAIINGEEIEVVESDFGANEFVVDFLKEAGFWDIITDMKPKMKKDNGYSSKIILGTLIMKELLAIGKLSGAGKILEDGKLASDIGFNIEKIKKAEKEEKGVIDLGTLRNHLKRAAQDESDKAFYQHIKILRDKRWISGHQYVADAVELEVPYGETFEGMGEVWKKKEKRYKYGYKLELLMNVTTTGRLRFVGGQVRYVVVLGLSVDESKLSLAKKLGADLVINIERGDAEQSIKDLTRGYGADVVLECSGSSPGASLGLKLVRKKGKFTQMGLFGKPIQLDFEQIAYKELKVTGFFSQKWTAWEKALKLLEQGKVLTKPLVTEKLPLTEWRTGFEKKEKGDAIKTV